MRLIDADALMGRTNGIFNDGEGIHYIDVADVETAPTIEAEPVRHGRWVEQQIKSVDSEEISKCSVCCYPVSTMWGKTNFCPNCGAKMDLQ